MNDKYWKLHEELDKAAHEIDPYYDIDKIKSYSVYIWTKGDMGENVFDIEEDKIVFYVDDYVIPDEVMPIIEKIQAKLRDISQYSDKE